MMGKKKYHQKNIKLYCLVPSQGALPRRRVLAEIIQPGQALPEELRVPRARLVSVHLAAVKSMRETQVSEPERAGY